MRLSSVVAEYVTCRRVGLRAGYLFDRAVTLFGVWLGHVPTLDDLTDMQVSGWMAAAERTYRPLTVSGFRTRILALWRFAAGRHGIPPPGEVRAEPPPEPQPRAWTVQQVASLVAACLLVDGGDYLRLLILAAYQTGLRKSDLMSLDRDQISADGVVRVRQHKTGWPHEPRLEPQTAAEILARPGQLPLRCDWSTRKYTARWARIRELAGVDSGGLQQLRRTGATAVACEHGLDAARQFLGHRSPEMVRHYVDRTIYRPRGVLPPRIP